MGNLVWGFNYDNYKIEGNITTGLYALSHWIFAAQYLRTSLLLPEMFRQSLLKVQLGLFEHEKLGSIEEDNVMNRISQSMNLMIEKDLQDISPIIQNLNLEGLKSYIEMIDAQKRRIQRT